jgi:hypothetical protein
MDVSAQPVTSIEIDYAERGMAERSDVELIQAVAGVVARPRRDPADSFVLHAPLELAARAALLPWIRPEARQVARLHIFAIGKKYDDFGPAIDGGQPAGALPLNTDPVRWLTDALIAGDLDAVDRAAIAIAERATPSTLPIDLTDLLLPLTSAAAHGPIFLYQFDRIGQRGELSAELLRPLAQSLGRNPSWRLRWIDEWHPSGETDAAGLEAVLAGVPSLGVPGSTFIHPLYMQVDESGFAAARLGPVVGRYSTAAARGILRTAARAMLVDSSAHVPYGWTHCLTLPQAVLGLANRSVDPDRALAIAATGVLAIRAALGDGQLDEIDVSDLPPVDRETLATDAATRHDAHVVKYTLACLDAASDDPDFAPLYLNAAARLLAWWDDAGGDPADPLSSPHVPH